MNHFIKNIKKYLGAAALMTGLFVNTSCEHKPLYLLDKNPRPVHLIFDWENLRPEDTKPDGMHITFNSDGDDDYGFDAPNTGIDVNIKPNNYIIGGYPNDVPGISTTPIGNDTEITVADPSEDVPSIYGVLQEELVENGTSEEGGPNDPQIIVAKPFPLNCIYKIRLINTDCVPNGIEWQGALTGLTDAIMLSNGKSSKNANEVTRQFPINNVVSPTERQTKISVLGKLSGKDNILKLKVKNSDGSIVTYKIDVTPQIDGASDFRNVEIVVDLKKYKPEDNEGAGSLNPDVDEFPNTGLDIIL